ncbi:MAG: FkbM family methyltransferase [Planctomycetaceae bacterium]
MLYRPHDVVIGRCLDCFGHFSPGEVELFRSLLSPGDVVVEAGAYIGCFTVPLADAVGSEGSVYAFEPNLDSFRILCGNLALNNICNVDARQCGLGRLREERAIPLIDIENPGNFGDVSLVPCGAGTPVEVTTIDALQLDRCDFVKADVQGMQRDVLLGAAETISKCRPILYLENDKREKSEALLATLDALGYRSFWHLPPICEPTSDDIPEDAVQLTQYVSVNILCLPEESDRRVAELRQVTSVVDWWRPDH